MYWKNLYLFALCFLTLGLLAQQKGVTPLDAGKEPKPTRTIHAVIVGVSEYADEMIPDLKYADEDALAFANWLLTQTGPDSPNVNLTLLNNKKATAGAVGKALDNLLKIGKRGDRVYLFFSGHSDIQRNIRTEPGYFLCHDSPSSLYAVGGTLPLDYLQVVISTLEAANGCEVILVMDACHSGKLSGNAIGGSHYVLENLEVSYPETTKFLSCRKLQYSLEGTQWGGGRGLFSFYFINGLKGLADINHDGLVSVLELERYVFDNVQSDAAPQAQSPQSFYKDHNEVMSTVIPVILDSLKRGNFDYPLAFNFAESKIVNNEYIFARDTSIKRTYEAFYESIAAKRLLSPQEDCAEYYYQKIIQNNKGKELHDEATRNFAVALQDDAQLIINELLNSKISRITLPGKDGMAEYAKLPTYLARAAALLGNKNKNYNNLKSNQCLFEAYLMQLNKRSFDSKTEKLKKRQLYHQALHYQPKNPLAAMFLSNQFATDFDDLDSCTYYFNYTKSLAPAWVIPRAYHAYMLNRYFDTLALAKTTIDEGLVLDSTNTTLIKSLGAYYFYREDYDNARMTYEKALALDSADYLTYVNLAATYQKVKDFEKAKFLYLKSISMISNQTSAYDGLGWMLYENGQYVEAATYYERGLQNNNQLIKLHYRVSLCYLDTKDWASVGSHVAQISKINPEDWRPSFLKACMAAIKGNDKAALQLLEEAVNKEMDDDYVLENRDYFKNLKTNKKYLELIEE